MVTNDYDLIIGLSFDFEKFSEFLTSKSKGGLSSSKSLEEIYKNVVQARDHSLDLEKYDFFIGPCDDDSMDVFF